MINSHLVQTNTRTGMAVRDILSIKRHSAVATFVLMLALVASVLAAGPVVHAQEQKPSSVAAVPTSKPVAKPAVTAEATRVNINTADAKTLAASLKGVGDARAMEIVRHREAYGPFASAEELTEVKGIGKATLEMNLDLITLE
jgi:competence protein ComEA